MELKPSGTMTATLIVVTTACTDRVEATTTTTHGLSYLLKLLVIIQECLAVDGEEEPSETVRK